MTYLAVFLISSLHWLQPVRAAVHHDGHVYRFYQTITVDGRERTYLLNLPPDYYQGNKFSLVIAMHGGGGNARQFERTSKLTKKANEAQFIVVYPEGVERKGLVALRTWNAGGCCDFARDNNIDDVKFISLLIDKLVSNYKINPKKVYATGHSNGGMLAYRLACEIPDKIAAIAPNSCTMYVSSCNPKRPVPILHMQSALDTKVPYKGGVGSGIGTKGINFPPIDSVLSVWSQKNGCKVTAKVVTDNRLYKLTQYTDCNGGVMISYYLTKDGGHGWPGGLRGGPMSDKPSTVINANDLLWDFFQKYQLP